MTLHRLRKGLVAAGPAPLNNHGLWRVGRLLYDIGMVFATEIHSGEVLLRSSQVFVASRFIRRRESTALRREVPFDGFESVLLGVVET